MHQAYRRDRTADRAARWVGSGVVVLVTAGLVLFLTTRLIPVAVAPETPDDAASVAPAVAGPTAAAVPEVAQRPSPAAAIPALDDVSVPTIEVQAVAPTQPAARPVDTLPLLKPAGPQAQFFLDGRWVQNHLETGLFSDPWFNSIQFALLPQWSSLRVIEARPGWLKVYYLGDQQGRRPGEAWIPAGAVGPVERPQLWGTTLDRVALHRSPGSDAGFDDLPRGALVELLGEPSDGRVAVRFPGDGETLAPGSGWLDLQALQPIMPPSRWALPWGYPYTTEGDVLRVAVPYRSQIDGSAYQAANCGPVALQMGLAAFGIDVSNALLRARVQDIQREWGDESGSYVWALAAAAREYRLVPVWLYGSSLGDISGPLRVWSAEDIRIQLRQGRPVIPQVWFRGLPGREEVDYWGDHYVVITGMIGEAFIYNDPVNRDGPGYDRLISEGQLLAAMENSAAPFAAFALAR